MSSLIKDDAVRYPARLKGTLGIPAFLVGYLLTFLWGAGLLQSVFGKVLVAKKSATPLTLAQFLATHGVSVPTWKGVGWLFYSAHFVSLSGPVRPNIISGAGGSLSLLRLVPPVVLVLAGALAAHGSYGRTIWHTGYSGALIFLGYFPAAVAGSLLFVVTIGLPMRPNILYSAVLVGAVYPVVFGAIGGGLMHEVHKRSVRREATVPS
jgi:hypothetical protein